MQTKKVLGCLALGLVMCFLAFAPSIVQAKPVTLRLAHSEAVTNIRHDVCLFFVKRAISSRPALWAVIRLASSRSPPGC